MIKDFEGCCFSKLNNSVVNVSFSPDSTLTAYRWNESVRVMNLDTLEVVREIPNGHDWVTCAFSPDSKMIAVGGAF